MPDSGGWGASLGDVPEYLENFGYRQINTVWRVWAIVSFLRKNTDWGAMERKGFEKGSHRHLMPKS
jgi:hypothetical protein